MRNKQLFYDELIKKVKALKKQGKKIVQTLGVFDLIHPGVIKHLNSAKAQGDVLIVTIIKDKDVRRGPGRPIFNEKMRMESVASLDQVDYVCLVDDEIPFESVRQIKPDVFAKGKDYKDRDQIIHGKIYDEEKKLNFGKVKIHETDGFSFSSSEIINNFLDIYPEETRHYLKGFREKFRFNQIANGLDKLKNLKVLLIGDGIIDEYHYTSTMGKSAKNPIIVNKYLSYEAFAGGSFAIANHLSGLCHKIQLVSVLGKEDSREEFISGNLKPNVSPKFFLRNDGPTIIKKRYIDQYRNQKLFEVNYLNDNYIDPVLEKEVVQYLESEIGKYDLVLVSDFGHGFLTANIIKAIEKTAKKYAVNAQTNAANAGYNMITKYRKPFFICLDEQELRMAAQDKHGDVEAVARKIKEIVRAQNLIVTLGKKGSLGIDRQGEVNQTPIFSNKVIDTIGAGDAFFAFTAPCFAVGLPLDLVSLIGNAVGALAVQIVGNKRSVEKRELLEFIHNIMK